MLKLSDCSQVSDGGSALLLCSEAGLLASSLRRSDAVELLCSSTRTCSLYDAPDDLTCLSTCTSAASSAYAEAKVSATDIDVAEVHDCFTITELMMYEALQLCSPGSAAGMLRAHETDLSGRIPVNTGGGLVGFGHPVGATGVKQVVEVWRQMKGKCGEYQLKKIPQIGVCANMGGEFECSRFAYSATFYVCVQIITLVRRGRPHCGGIHFAQLFVISLTNITNKQTVKSLFISLRIFIRRRESELALRQN